MISHKIPRLYLFDVNPKTTTSEFVLSIPVRVLNGHSILIYLGVLFSFVTFGGSQSKVLLMCLKPIGTNSFVYTITWLGQMDSI
ncbi:hypothetical protein PHJA_002577500 [Phtheirospermum japonicum]|uniref:Uncharacterized protein n=1 Tax=Phtheirospermum japonicum TaxID=374723 RepID=A0A830DB85_9LAMI|nr:hypothetical protein PHJA_002577500 [Phtheirospermum japonicum]